MSEERRYCGRCLPIACDLWDFLGLAVGLCPEKLSPSTRGGNLVMAGLAGQVGRGSKLPCRVFERLAGTKGAASGGFRNHIEDQLRSMDLLFLLSLLDP